MSNITPRVDIAFKKIFGVEENKDLLISLLNSIVTKEDQLSNIILLNPYNAQNFKNDKLSILDIKAEGPTGKRYNIEIQIANEADYDKRALYYWAKLYSEQLKESDDFSTLTKAIGIHILNFTSIPSSSKYHNIFRIKEIENGTHYFDNLELHTIELRKFIEKIEKQSSLDECAQLAQKIKSSLDLWVAFLTKHNLLTKLPVVIQKEPQIKKALHVLDVMNFNDVEREEYENHLKWLRIQVNTLKNIAQQAEARGEIKGKIEGIEETILQMYIYGLKIEKITNITGKSIEQIEKIIDKIHRDDLKS